MTISFVKFLQTYSHKNGNISHTYEKGTKIEWGWLSTTHHIKVRKEGIAVNVECDEQHNEIREIPIEEFESWTDDHLVW